MNLPALRTALLVLLASPMALAETAEPAVAFAADDPGLAWGPCPEFMPEGCQISVLNGDPAGAETELQKARDLGHSPEAVTPLLVRSRLAQGQFQKVTNDFANTALTAPEAQAELKTLVAVAWRQQGKRGTPSTAGQ